MIKWYPHTPSPHRGPDFQRVSEIAACGMIRQEEALYLIQKTDKTVRAQAAEQQSDTQRASNYYCETFIYVLGVVWDLVPTENMRENSWEKVDWFPS